MLSLPLVPAQGRYFSSERNIGSLELEEDEIIMPGEIDVNAYLRLPRTAVGSIAL
jgi:hypothetical protein